MRWVMHVVDRMKDWASMRSQHRADEALQAADATAVEIERITDEISASDAILRSELEKLAAALQRRRRG
jgi:hypothetical protein